MPVKSFKYQNSIYDVPEEKITDFLQRKPGAIEINSFIFEGDTFDVPLQKVQEFLQRKPTAQPLYQKQEQLPIQEFDPSTLPELMKQAMKPEQNIPELPKEFQVPSITKEESEAILSNANRLKAPSLNLPEVSIDPRNKIDYSNVFSDKFKQDFDRIYGGALQKSQYKYDIGNSIAQIEQNILNEQKRQDAYRYGIDWLTGEPKTQFKEGDIQNQDEFKQSYNTVNKLRHSKDLLKKANIYLENGGENALKEFYKGLTSPLATDFLTFGLNEMGRNLSVAGTALKIMDGKPVTDEEQKLLETYNLLKEIQSDPNYKPSFGYDAGHVIEEMIPYVAQFALTSGISSGVQAGIKASGKKVLGKTVEKGVGKAVLGLTGYTAGAFGQALAMPQLYSQLGTEITEGKDPKKAFFSAWTKTAGEVFGERSGDFLQKGLMKFAMGKQGARLFNQYRGKLAKAIGWNGPWEVLEENITNIWNAALTDEREWDNFWDWREQGLIALTVGIMGVPMATTNIIQKQGIKNEYKTSKQELENISTDLFEQANQSFDPENMSNTLTKFYKLSNDLNLSPDERLKLFDYAKSRYRVENLTDNERVYANEMAVDYIDRRTHESGNIIKATDNNDNVFYVTKGDVSNNSMGEQAFGIDPENNEVELKRGKGNYKSIEEIEPGIIYQQIIDKANEDINSELESEALQDDIDSKEAKINEAFRFTPTEIISYENQDYKVIEDNPDYIVAETPDGIPKEISKENIDKIERKVKPDETDQALDLSISDKKGKESFLRFAPRVGKFVSEEIYNEKGIVKDVVTKLNNKYDRKFQFEDIDISDINDLKTPNQFIIVATPLKNIIEEENKLNIGKMVDMIQSDKKISEYTEEERQFYKENKQDVDNLLKQKQKESIDNLNTKEDATTTREGIEETGEQISQERQAQEEERAEPEGSEEQLRVRGDEKTGLETGQGKVDLNIKPNQLTDIKESSFRKKDYLEGKYDDKIYSYQKQDEGWKLMIVKDNQGNILYSLPSETVKEIKSSQPRVEEETKPSEEKAASEKQVTKKVTEEKPITLAELLSSKKETEIDIKREDIERRRQEELATNQSANIDDINAKYDKELKNLKEQSKSTEKQKEPTLPETLKPDINQKAKDYLGTTDNILRAGFITKEGELLDIFKKKKGRLSHSEALEEALGKTGEIDLNSFLDIGNIRIVPGTGEVELHNNPNSNQSNQLINLINKRKGNITLDLIKGNKKYSLEYNEGTDANKILSDINEFYKSEQQELKNINYLPEIGGIEIFSKPSDIEKQSIKDFINKIDKNPIIYLPDKQGYATISARYDNDTRPLKILSDINKYFNEGIRPITPLFKKKISKPKKATTLYETLESKEQKQFEKDLNDLANAMGKRFNTTINIVNEKDLPETVYEYIKSKSEEGQNEAVFDPNSGEVYVIKDNIKENPEKAILHETITHRGVRLVLGSDFNPTMAQIYDSMPAKEKNNLEILYGKGITKIAEEHLASFAEKNEYPNYIQQVIAKIREILRQYFPNLRWSNNDIKNLLRKSKEYLERTNEETQLKELEKLRSVQMPSPDLGIKMINNVVDQVSLNMARSQLPAKKFQDKLIKRGAKLTDSSNYIQREKLKHSRKSEKFKKFNEKYAEPLEGTLREFRKLGATEEDVDWYRRAKHAPETNQYFKEKAYKDAYEKYEKAKAKLEKEKSGFTEEKYAKELDKLKSKKKKLDKQLADIISKKAFPSEEVFGSGFSEKEANLIVKEFERKYPKSLIDKFHSQVNDINNFILDEWLENGLIDKQLYDDLKSRYKYYCPYRGWDKQYDNIYVWSNDSMGKGKVTLLKKAGGRETKSDMFLPHLYHMAQSAITVGERNRAVSAMGNLMKQNQDKLEGLGGFKEYYTYEDKNGDIQEVAELGQLPDDILEDKSYTKHPYSQYKRYITREQANEREVDYFSGGKRYTMYFIDPEVSRTLNNNYDVLNSDIMQKIMEVESRTIGAATRLWSQAQTTYNPVFAPVNLWKDYRFGAKATFVEGGIKQRALFEKNFWKAARAIKRKNFSYDPELAKRWKLFDESGAKTGWTQLKNTEQIKRNIKKKVNQARINPFKAIELQAKLTNKLSEWSEDTTRFAAFMTALDMGKSVEQAAAYAKNFTVNFNEKGRMTPMFNSIYGFFNARVQGLIRYGQLWGINPVRMAVVSAMDFTTGYLLRQLLHQWWGDDDADEKEAGISEYMKMNYNNIPIPGSDDYISIPLSHGYGMFNAIGSMVYDFLHGKTDAKRFAERSERVFLNAVGQLIIAQNSPVDLTKLYDKDNDLTLRPLIPSVLMPLFDVWTNSNYGGYQVYPNPRYAYDVPKSQLYYKSTSDAAIKFSQMLYKLGGGDLEEDVITYYDEKDKKQKTVSKWLDISPSAVEHVFKQSLGGFGKFYVDTYKSLFEPLIKGSVEALNDKNVQSGIKVFSEQFKETDPYDIPFAQRFWRKSRTGQFSRDLYPLKQQVILFEKHAESVERNYRRLIEEGQEERAEKFKERHEVWYNDSTVARMDSLSLNFKDIKTISKEIKMLEEENPELIGGEKFVKLQIEELKAERDSIENRIRQIQK